MKKKIAFLFLLLIGFCLASCRNESKPANEIVIGFSQLGNESAWRERNTKSILTAAEMTDYKILFENAQQNQSKQIKAVRSFIASRVDVIVLSPIVETGWENVLQEAEDAKIPVILNDRGIVIDDPNLYKTLVGTNGIEQGRRAADFLKKKFANHSEMINIAEIAGTAGSSSAESRAKGFRESIQDDPRFQIVTSVNGDYMLSKGRQAVAHMDESGKLNDIDVLFSHNDDMTIGIIQYLETTSIKPGKDLVIVSVDAQQEAIELLKAGKINCTVECNPNSGPKIMSVINHLLNGGELDDHYYLQEQVFSEYTDFESIKDRGY